MQWFDMLWCHRYVTIVWSGFLLSSWCDLMWLDVTFSIIFSSRLPPLCRLLSSESYNQYKPGEKLLAVWMKTFSKKKNNFSHKLRLNPFVPILENYYNFQNCFDGAISCHFRQCQSRSYHLDLSTLHFVLFSIQYSIHHILSPDLTITINSFYILVLTKLKLLFLPLLIANGNYIFDSFLPIKMLNNSLLP